MSGLICAGNVYLNRKVSGSYSGFHGPINATKFAISVGKSNTIERTSYMRDSYGQTLDSVVIPGSSTLTIETDDAAADILQYMLLGTLTDVTGNTTAVVDEAVTGYLGKWTKLSRRNIGSVTVKNSAATTTYVNGTDYTLDAVAGMIKPLASGAMTDGQSLKVDFTPAAMTARQIIAATSTEVRAMVRLDGTNLSNQKKVEVLCHEAVLIPSGELDLAGKKFLTFGLSGTLITPTGETGPLSYREID